MIPSALPSSLWVSRFLAVILKKGPSVLSWRSRFWVLDEAKMSAMVGKVTCLGFSSRSALFLRAFKWVCGVKGEKLKWVFGDILGFGK